MALLLLFVPHHKLCSWLTNMVTSPGACWIRRFASRGVYAIDLATRSGDAQSSVTVPRSKIVGDDLRNNVAAALSSVGYRTGTLTKSQCARARECLWQGVRLE